MEFLVVDQPGVADFGGPDLPAENEHPQSDGRASDQATRFSQGEVVGEGRHDQGMRNKKERSSVVGGGRRARSLPRFPARRGLEGEILSRKQGLEVVCHPAEFLLLQPFLLVDAPVFPVVETAFDLAFLIEVELEAVAGTAPGELKSDLRQAAQRERFEVIFTFRFRSFAQGLQVVFEVFQEVLTRSFVWIHWR